jgi:RNA polymerase sigma factor (sigma-70 family)
MDSDEIGAQLERYHAESYGWARCCCRQDPSEAENVLQTAYLKIFQRQAVFDGRSAFRTWLFSLIRNTAAEARRRRFLSRLGLIRYRDLAPRPNQPAPENAVYLDQLQSKLRGALRDLPLRQAEVLQLVFYHELSLAEAAGVTGVSLGSARTHYARGKARLRIWAEAGGIQVP